MSRCQICGKRTRTGWNVSHSHIRTRRKFGANIQKITFTVSGIKKQMRLCTKCIKKLRNNMEVNKFAQQPKEVKIKKIEKIREKNSKSSDKKLKADNDHKISKPCSKKRVSKSKKGK